MIKCLEGIGGKVDIQWIACWGITHCTRTNEKTLKAREMEEVGEVETQLDDDTRCQARVVVEIWCERTRDGCDGCENASVRVKGASSERASCARKDRMRENAI